MAAAISSELAVVSPRTCWSPRARRMAPAPTKPTAATTDSISRVGSMRSRSRYCSWVKCWATTSPRPTIRAAAPAISMCVRRPAAWRPSSRSMPSTPPSAIAAATRIRIQSSPLCRASIEASHGYRWPITSQRRSAGREAADRPQGCSSGVTDVGAGPCLQSVDSKQELAMRGVPLVAVPLLLALPLAAFAQATPREQAPPAGVDAPKAAATPPPTASAAELATFRSCMGRLRGAAAGKGVDGASFDRLAAGLAPDMTVLPLLDQQPEFSTPIWDYLAALVDRERVDDGLAMLARHAGVLARVQAEYGVDPATVVAVWGVESDYGRSFGKRPLLTSLSTLSCFGRRQPFFQGELIATLQLLARGDLVDPGITGSWAGAFGHTQFMPTTYQRIAVDFDGDGRRDLVGSIPDALGSTANYLKKSGWRSGEPWGYEVALPAGFDAAQAGRTRRKPLSAWVGQGVPRWA